jgi:hypothetical protein
MNKIKEFLWSMHFKGYKKHRVVCSKKDKNMIDQVQNLNKTIVK